jgi:hypothetical protein
VEEGVRGVSDLTGVEAALYGGLGGGLIGGVFALLGVVVERLIQRYGRIRCVMEPIEIYTSESPEDVYPLRRLPVPADYLPAPDAGTYNDYAEPLVRCSIKAKMFNEKEARTGLRDVVLVFDGSPPLESSMKDRSTRRDTASGIRMDELEKVNLPSREWIVLSLEAIIDAKDAQSLATSKQAWLRGCYPDGRLFSERVPTQEA